MAYNSNNRSERLLQGRRFTTDELSLAQEAFTDVLDLGASEILTDDGLIPSGSSQLPYSGSTQNSGIVSGSVVNPSIGTDVNVLKFHHRKKLKPAGNGNRQVYYFTTSDPSSPTDSVSSDQLIETDQQTNFISPKYIIAAHSARNAEAITTGYKAVVYKDTSSTANGISTDAITDDKYVFDYKTGVLTWNSGEAPSSSQYVYMTVYQYAGRTLRSQIDDGSIGGSSDLTISSSAQIASDISGSLGANATFIRSLTATSVSESFVAPSSSFSTRVSTLEGNVGQQLNTDSEVTFATISATSLNVTSVTSSIVTSSILQTEGSNIFGDASNDTHTFQGNITASGNISASGTIVGSNLSGTNTGDQDLSTYALISQISGSLGTNATLIRSLTATSISESFVAPSSSFSTRVTTNDAKVGYTDAAVTGVINAAGIISSSAQLPSGIFSSSLQTFTNITASGNISASGNVYASNIVLPNDGIIAPSVNHQTIKFMTKPPGTSDNGERFTLGPDLIEFSGITGNDTNYSLLKMDMTDGSEAIQFNATQQDVDFKIHSDNIAAMVMDAGHDAFAFRDHVGIGYDANKWPTSDYSLSGTFDKQLMVSGITHLTGSVEIVGPITTNITASGDISASANVYANRYYVDGKLAIDYAGTSITYGQNNQELILRGSTILFGADNTQHVTASGNISASGTITANAFVGDGSGITGLTSAAIASTANGADNRIATYTGADSLNGESNLTFDGTSLDLTGNITASGAISASEGLIGTLTGTATSASRADAANKVYTSQDNSNAEHFITFVDSDNVVHADEDVHTTNFLRVNPEERLLIVQGGIKIPGSDITLESGSISASRDIFAPAITASGTISSSGDIHSATIRYVANIHDANNAAMISGTSTALSLGDISNAENQTKITINDSTRAINFTADDSTALQYAMPGTVTTNRIKVKNLEGQSPLIIEPTTLIISASDEFSLGVGGTSSSIFLSASLTSSTGTPKIGFNTREPQTDFDVSAREVQFQKPGTRQGLKINDEGNIESFNNDSATAATGSEFILNYSRGVTINAASMVAVGFGPFAADSADADAQALFDTFAVSDQSKILQQLESEGFISPPQTGDTIGSIRWIAQSGSTEDFDARGAGEAAAIVAKVNQADETGISADLIFSVANKEGGSGQKMLLDADGAHEMTGSLSLGGNLIGSGFVSTTGDITAGDDLFVGDDIELTSDASKIKFGADGDTSITHVHNAGFLINANRYLSFRDGAVRINSGDDGHLDLHADTAIRSNGNLIPDTDDTNTLGTETHRWNDVFSVSTTTGGVFEVGLRTKDIGKLETGTIVSWKDGKCIPCCKSEDNMVMGVIKQGKDEPIVLGAEPVLVTGKVEEGDYIVTSEIVGHGKAAKEGYIFKKNLFGRVIAQALESAEGDSSLIKCMIRKM